jgi:hypothetical protein
VKVTKDMLDLAKHIVTQKAADFEPERFEDHYEAALAELINAKRNGKTVGAKPRPRGENVVDLMDALKKSIAGEAAQARGKKPRKASAGQKEMLLPIEGKSPSHRRGTPSRDGSFTGPGEPVLSANQPTRSGSSASFARRPVLAQVPFPLQKFFRPQGGRPGRALQEGRPSESKMDCSTESAER